MPLYAGIQDDANTVWPLIHMCETEGSPALCGFDGEMLCSSSGSQCLICPECLDAIRVGGTRADSPSAEDTPC